MRKFRLNASISVRFTGPSHLHSLAASTVTVMANTSSRRPNMPATRAGLNGVAWMNGRRMFGRPGIRGVAQRRADDRTERSADKEAGHAANDLTPITHPAHVITPKPVRAKHERFDFGRNRPYLVRIHRADAAPTEDAGRIGRHVMSLNSKPLSQTQIGMRSSSGGYALLLELLDSVGDGVCRACDGLEGRMANEAVFQIAPSADVLEGRGMSGQPFDGQPGPLGSLARVTWIGPSSRTGTTGTNLPPVEGRGGRR